MSKNVAVFVDVANIFYAAKAAGVDIDYVTLLKSATAGRDLVRAYAYTGLDPENENQRNFHSFLARHGYKVVSKDIRKYGDGKVKANLDIELVIDMMKTARNLDIAIVVSGDGDFAPAIRAVQEMGVRVEVISFRGNTSSDLIDVADLFTDIVQLARVEKASSRSGRRVAGDDEDLSMTEVPDKQTEGSGAGRGRGRGRRAAGGRDAEPAASRGGRRPAEPAAVVTSSGAPLVVLPGEKLSKVSPAAIAERGEGVEDDEATAPADAAFATVGAAERAEDGETGGRRRRRRGGRGRGRGRQRGEGGEQRLPAETEMRGELDVAEEEEFVAPPRAPRSTPFGSVWDSQLGVPTSVPSTAPPVGGDDEEDFEEPEIPEYLIAERRNRGRGPATNRGRGNRSAYAAAMDRERFGGGRGGGINRYPDVGDRGRAPQGPGAFPRRDRQERPDRDRPQRPDRDRFERPPRSGDEPWSEVPPELEAMLRAQVASRPRSEPAPRDTSDGRGEARTEVTVDAVAVPIEVVTPAEPAADAAVADTVAEPAAPAEAPKRRATRRTTKASEAENASKADAPKRRTSARKPATTKAAAGDTEKPKRRTTRRKASESETDEAATAADAGTE